MKIRAKKKTRSLVLVPLFGVYIDAICYFYFFIFYFFADTTKSRTIANQGSVEKVAEEGCAERESNKATGGEKEKI